MSTPLRSATLALTIVAIALALAGCLRFSSVAQGVHVWPTPEDPSEAYCHELHITAEFGIHTLIDRTFTVGDDDVFHFETPDAPTQPHYRGMPLTIDVTCYDTNLATIGESHHQGHLTDRWAWATVAIFNYPLQNECIPPTNASGTQVCLGDGGGYDWD